MRKGIGITMVGGVILASVGIAVLIGVYTTSSGSSQLFCNSYQKVSFAFPGQKAPPPKGCETGSEKDYEALRLASHEELGMKMMSGIAECWRKYRGYETRGELCKGWNIVKMEGEVNETYLTDEMSEKGICPETIQNSDLEYSGEEGCGDENQVKFYKEKITEGDFVIIEYNTTFDGLERIEVR